MDPTAKLAESLPRVMASLREVIDDLDVTTDEWMAVLAFLTDVGRAEEFVLLSDVMRLSVHVDQRTHGHSAATPSNVEGPFWFEPGPPLEPPYRIGRHLDAAPALFMSGRVMDVDGNPVPRAELDVWQSDERGVYDFQDPDHIADRDLRGRLWADEAGRYEFRTVRPAPYEVKNDGPVGRLLELLGRHAFRPAHIHLKVQAEGHEPLTTMVFLPNDPWLEDDTIDAVKDALVLDVERVESETQLRARGMTRPFDRATFDIVLAPAVQRE